MDVRSGHHKSMPKLIYIRWIDDLDRIVNTNPSRNIIKYPSTIHNIDHLV